MPVGTGSGCSRVLKRSWPFRPMNCLSEDRCKPVGRWLSRTGRIYHPTLDGGCWATCNTWYLYLCAIRTTLHTHHPNGKWYHLPLPGTVRCWAMSECDARTSSIKHSYHLVRTHTPAVAADRDKRAPRVWLLCRWKKSKRIPSQFVTTWRHVKWMSLSGAERNGTGMETFGIRSRFQPSPGMIVSFSVLRTLRCALFCLTRLKWANSGNVKHSASKMMCLQRVSCLRWISIDLTVSFVVKCQQVFLTATVLIEIISVVIKHSWCFIFL